MNKELDIWNHALSALGRGERCVLLVVVESIGSSPGRAGFKALVTAAGELHGSIGGGSMEHKLVELARARLAAAATGSSPSDPASTTDASTTDGAAGSRGGDPAEGNSGDPEGAMAGRPFLKRQIHRADAPADRSGMICSGEQTVAFYPLGEERLHAVEQVVASMGKAEG
ncbi:MAG: XdhC family protein, partial [Bacteroidetes bacterium]|nr:XdhC family protein [Bacteroidota bacterium]